MIRRLFTSALLSIVAGLGAVAQMPATELKGDVRLIVANDLGRNGYHEQKPIADLMGNVSDAVGADAILALGDTHHYMGVGSVNDPLWMTNYELIYSHPELQIAWYPLLGNHEYRGNTQAVIDYSGVSRRWVMPSRFYTRIFNDGDTRVKVVFIDTTPLIDKYHGKKDKYPDIDQQDASAQLQWLESELSRDDKADWVVVVGHHPIYAFTDKDNSERSDMQTKVDPALRKYKVDMYVCGHIHNFQHIQKNGIDYVVNTSGSLSRTKVKPIDGTVFCDGGPGFSLITATPKSLTLSMIDRTGNVIHQVSRTK